MLSPTWWTWVWANSRRLWRTGKPGMLQSMGSQWVRDDLVTEQQQQQQQNLKTLTLKQKKKKEEEEGRGRILANYQHNQKRKHPSPDVTKRSSYGKCNNLQQLKFKTGTSLVVEWRRVHLPMKRTQVWPLVWEDSVCYGQLNRASHNYWAPVPTAMEVTGPESMLHSKRSHCNEKPAHCN